MSCRLMILSTLLVNVLIACGDPKPVSTGTKAPGLQPATKAPTTTPAATGGDATKGQTALTSSCLTCHGKSAHGLSKSDVGSIDAAGAKAYHAGVATVFKSNGPDIKAYLATQ